MISPSEHSFAVCAYGESPYLKDCVASLVRQTTKTNVLMVTSTPNDHIAEVAERYGVTLHESGQEPGIGSDWNYAVSCAETPYVTVAHQDDVYLPGYAKSVLEMMSRATHPLICFTDYAELRGDKVVANNQLLRTKRMLLRPMRRQPVNASRRAKRSILALGSAICCPSVTYCKPNLPTPLFTDQLSCDLDWDAWERFSLLEGEFLYADEILMYHRIHEESETSRLIRDNTRTQEDLAMLGRFWPAPVARMINTVYSRSQKSNG